ncbi:ABC transporter ATP-binding protein [Pontibacter sp. G13]|uniref:ABC transporter ATP-binding protein n=1 Tax=Pontibacter sp. G13 TaxID=3074898 RepID=UPI00288AFE7D|nr:ABC transporter ATP-binding protein [Pontibacter sp. G13]WNJ18525.1 ABC transporter ATP-binding protein [Pontibacter sp. G13]
MLYTIFSTFSLISIIPFLEILFDTQTVLAAPETPLDVFDSQSLKDHGYYQLYLLKQTLPPGDLLLRFCIFLLGSIFLKSISRYLTSWFMAPFEEGIVRKIRNKLFEHLARLDLKFYTKNKKGDIINTVVGDVQVVQQAIIGTLQTIVREPFVVIALLLTMVAISWKLTLFTLILLPITGLLINNIAKPLKLTARKGQDVLGEQISLLDEFISGIRIVKSFQKEQYEKERFEETNQAYADLQVSIRRRVAIASPLTEVLSIGVICTIIYYGGSLILNEGASSEIKASEFIGFIGVFSQLLQPIKAFSNALTKVQKGIAAHDRIQKLLDEEPQIQEVDNPIRVEQFADNISFENVWFKYQEEDILKDVSFSIKKGQTVALVGPSGSGKSTLADLIPRFYEPYQGTIKLDGKPTNQMAIANLRGLIGVVSQEGILFHDTVLNNIAYGLKDRNREEVIEAAKIANAHEFIMELPQGYDTVIGERGTKLSGGQRQRISIARAVLRNPPILILDEATSNLDTESERLVQDALDSLMQNRTSLVIAHRLSTIQQADQILALKEGGIAERGTHDQLLDADGVYSKLYHMQFAG